jgi:hypothetical protein
MGIVSISFRGSPCSTVWNVTQIHREGVNFVFALDRMTVRRPGPFVRLFGLLLCVISVIVLSYSVIVALGGGLIAVIIGCVGVAGCVGTLRLSITLMFVGWDTVLDRQARSVTRTAKFIRTIREERFDFDDFDAVEVQVLGSGQPDVAGPVAVVLMGPDMSLDIDDPGSVTSAALLQLLARVAASYDRRGRLALAASLAGFAGWRLRVAPSQFHRSPTPPRRSPNETPMLESGMPALVIPRIPLGMRIAAAVLVVAGTTAIVLIATIMPRNGGLETARNVVGLLALALIPLAGALSLAYRSRVEFDFPSRLMRRTGSFLWTRWDETYKFEQFEAIAVREVKVPMRRTPAQFVFLSGGFYEIGIYDDRSIPDSLLNRRAQHAQADRCRASAGTLAALCGLPMRLVAMDIERAEATTRANEI